MNEKEISIIMKMYAELYELEKYEKQTLMQLNNKLNNILTLKAKNRLSFKK